MITITRKFEFEAAHYLMGYEGACKNVHGHTYKLEVEIWRGVGESDVDESTGMVMDFAVLKNTVGLKVISVLDHTLLNDTIRNPTCENVLRWIFSAIGDLPLSRLRLYETSNFYAEWRECNECEYKGSV